MLEIRQVNNAAGAVRYCNTPDVQIDGVELPPQQWQGGFAEHLGLENYTRESFAHLLHNRHPKTGKPLTRATRDDRTAAYEFCFTSPKSASIALAVGGDTRIIGAFTAATDEAMREAETLMQVRVRVQKQDHDRESPNLAHTGFLHLTGREDKGKADPHLHRHVVVTNHTLDPVEGKIKAGQFRPVKTAAPFLQAAFHNAFARNLRQLGYQLDVSRSGFEIAGIPPKVIKEFSTRKGVVERAAEALGVFTGKGKSFLARTTRERKTKPSQWTDLQAKWQERCPDLGKVWEVVDKAKETTVPDRSEEVYRRAERFSLFRLHGDTLTRALEEGMGEVTLSGLKEAKAKHPHRKLRARLKRQLDAVMGIDHGRDHERQLG